MLMILGFTSSKTFGQETVHTVQVTNLENVKGTLYIGWYDKADDFRINDKAIYRAEIKVSDLSAVVAEFDHE